MKSEKEGKAEEVRTEDAIMHQKSVLIKQYRSNHQPKTVRRSNALNKTIC